MKKWLLCSLMFVGALFGHESDRASNGLWKTFFRSLRTLDHQDILDGEVLIARHNKVLLHLKSRRMKGKTPLFMIGSESKQFTSVALLKALYDTSSEQTEEEKTADVEQRLQLPISSYLGPEDPIWGNDMPSWAGTITLHQLLSMTSGIQDFTEVPAYMEADPHHKKKLFCECAHSGREILDLVKNLPLLFTPGTTYWYSNTNYSLLSYVLQKVAGTSYKSYLDKKLFSPLSLRHTSLVCKGRWPELRRQGKYRKLVNEWNYDRVARSKRLYSPSSYENLSNAIGAGSIVSTAKDLIKWNKGLYEENFLPPGMLGLFTTPNLNGYGYGIKITEHPYGLVYQHEGAIDTFRTELIYFERQHISLVYLSPIQADSNKLTKVSDAWSNMLENVIPDPAQRAQRINSTITFEYPELRDGEEKTQALLALFFGITPISRS